MWVYEGGNCHAFWDKQLFYILVVRINSVNVTGVSTFSASGVVLVPVKLPGSNTLYSLGTYYWAPTDRTNTLPRDRS